MSPLTGFADAERPDLDALAPHTAVGEHLFCGTWPGQAPPGWRIDAELPVLQMVWDSELPRGGGELPAVRLGREHVDAMLELVALTQPGPFGPRTIEMGDYFGIFDGTRLVAMAGERMWPDEFREISGVCTHPDRQGKGLARGLMHRLIGLQTGRGLVPFLHVMSFNARAIELYESMGFRRHAERVLRAVCRE